MPKYIIGSISGTTSCDTAANFAKTLFEEGKITEGYGLTLMFSSDEECHNEYAQSIASTSVYMSIDLDNYQVMLTNQAEQKTPQIYLYNLTKEKLNDAGKKNAFVPIRDADIVDYTFLSKIKECCICLKHLSQEANLHTSISDIIATLGKDEYDTHKKIKAACDVAKKHTKALSFSQPDDNTKRVLNAIKSYPSTQNLIAAVNNLKRKLPEPPRSNMNASIS